MSENSINKYNSLPRQKKKISPLPPPRKSSIPAGLGANAQSPRRRGNLVKSLSLATSCASSPTQLSPSIFERTTHPLTATATKHTSSCVMATVRRVPSISPTPKSRPLTAMSRSHSCDQLAQKKDNSKVFELPPPPVPGRPVMVAVAPPVIPCQGTAIPVPTPTPRTHRQPDPSPPSPPSPSLFPSTKSSSYQTLECLSTILAKSLPLRIELMEGYMSNSIPHITFSTSDSLNIHLLKQQEVIRVKDGKGQTYSIPLYSTIKIGMIQDTLADASEKHPTAIKTTKVSDILTMKELPKILCATKTVKSSYGEKSSIEEKEVLVVLGIQASRRRRKKVLEVFSVNFSVHKMLYPECAGHFSLSPSLTSLPLSAFFKHIQDAFPFKAHLFFSTESLTSSMSCAETATLPASLTQGGVMVLKKTLETSVIASPYFDDTLVSLCNENLINIPLDRYLNKLEISVMKLDSIEQNKLFSDSLLVYEKVNLSRIKYYHDAETEEVHQTQTCLYTKCQSKGRIGIKMDQPVWRPQKVAIEKRSSTSLEKEAQESVLRVLGSPEVQSSDILDPRRKSQSESSIPEGGLPPAILERCPTSKGANVLRSSQSEVISALAINQRPPCPVPKSSHLLQSLSGSSISREEVPPTSNSYQTRRQALMTSISTFDKEKLTNFPQSAPHTPSRHINSGAIPPRDLQRSTAQGKASVANSPDHWNTLPQQQHQARIHLPLPPIPSTSSTPPKGIYQVPRRAVEPHPKSRSSSTECKLSSSIDHTQKDKNHAPQRKSSSDLYDDDAEVYEEMQPLTRGRSPIPARHKLAASAISGLVGEESSSSGSSSSSDAKTRNSSVGYEIFDPHVTMKMFKALKVEVSSLGKDLQDLSEKLTRLETSELKSSTQRKEVCQPEEGGKEADAQATTQQERNKEFLKTLTCVQVTEVFEGLHLKQYSEVMLVEGVDGQILVELDEETLQAELGMSNKIHRLKVLKLICGEYDPRTYMTSV